MQAARSLHSSWNSCVGRPATCISAICRGLNGCCCRQVTAACSRAVRQSVATKAGRCAAATVAPSSQHGSTCGTRRSLPAVSCTSSSGSISQCSQPNEGPQHISWLHQVQAWQPLPQGTTDPNNNNNNNNNNNSGSRTQTFSTDMAYSSTSGGSSNGSGSGSSNGSSRVDVSSLNTTYHPPTFQQLPESQLWEGSSRADAIVVLAGGLTPDGGLPEWVHRRLDVARDLHMIQGRAPPIVCAGGGTPHKPTVVGANGHAIHESTSCATYLMATGVQADSIYKEVSSFDTVGNAYFSLAIHAIPAGWRRLVVVTSDFHMPRSRALFADIYRLAGLSIYNDPSWFSLTFVSASDAGVFDGDVYNARLSKEAGSLAHWQQVAAGLHSWPAFHEWFFHEHLCYAVPRQHEFGKRTIQDQRLLDSY